MSGSPTGDGATCPVCNAENPSGSRFCERCGSRLPVRPREATSDWGSTEITPPIGRDEATATFQQLPSEPAPRQQQEPSVSETPAAPEVFERTLIGTPPLANFVREERAIDDERVADSGPPEQAPSEPAENAEPASVPHTLPTESLRDRPTMTFQLPDLSTPTSESRNAATVSFDLPKLPPDDRPVHGSSTDTANEPAPPSSNQPGEGNWSYQSWRPDSATNQPPPIGATDRPSDPRPVGEVDEVLPRASTPLASPGTPPPGGAPPPAAPPARQDGLGAGKPPAYPPSTPSGPPANITYPSVSVGQTQPLQSYGQPPTAPPRPSGYPPTVGAAQPGMTAYPTPVAPKNNRALWIILGIIAAVIFICVVGCILLALLGAIGGAGASSSFATAVPTVTR